MQPDCTFDIILTSSVQYDKILSKFGEHLATSVKSSTTSPYFTCWRGPMNLCFVMIMVLPFPQWIVSLFTVHHWMISLGRTLRSWISWSTELPVLNAVVSSASRYISPLDKLSAKSLRSKICEDNSNYILWSIFIFQVSVRYSKRDSVETPFRYPHWYFWSTLLNYLSRCQCCHISQILWSYLA